MKNWIWLFTLMVPALAISATPAPPANTVSTAIFAGGCFWCSESDFEKVPGVQSVESGYIGGDVANPTYQQVSAGGTGHAEAIRVRYDAKQVSYADLLDVFWHSVDPYTPDAQFCDHGHQYRSAIFFLDDAQRQAAERTRDALSRRYPERPPIVTEIVTAGTFWPAEDYHQDYYKKNPVRYRYYRYGCGRDARLDDLWGSDRPHH
ncbi:peptide-methionine (S)-S-oxide reductase MsrA [Sinimarinibacterium sp. CAU 1509]|uniref:peptide-methionine (S)-S-oxide reductase MsrA n=1 Tax=Sinimarinibacterium sp. CAU 1509 TaxID=2562283 RepID=UPI0010ACF54F|nr:peptide-methionine (S)-S-oxide reductase MsrA [Sinimarinibacterium sp. CAU 1509]TJY58953.1 peptide-methionine (S)-S-oxide reductase MsrA [Sinimarinibacterium sp. CAU 1509]